MVALYGYGANAAQTALSGATDTANGGSGLASLVAAITDEDCHQPIETEHLSAKRLGSGIGLCARGG